MQLVIPIFPSGTKMISNVVGVYEKDGIVQYIANGLPIYAHDKEDLSAFRYFTSNLISMGLCRQVEIQRCFGVSSGFVSHSYKMFKEQGESAFFRDENRHGHSHKIIGARKERIQRALFNGQSVNSIAKKECVAEGSIRYAIRVGNLVKKKRE